MWYRLHVPRLVYAGLEEELALVFASSSTSSSSSSLAGGDAGEEEDCAWSCSCLSTWYVCQGEEAREAGHGFDRVRA